MKKDRKKKLRIYWAITLIPVAAAILFAVFYTIFGGKGHLRKITYPADSGGTVNGKAEMTVWFFDVGQADASLIRLPDGRYVMIDTGSNDSENLLSAYLKDLGVKKIDALFLSHGHEDHIGGADLLIRKYDVPQVIINQYPDDSVSAEKLLESVKDKSLKLSVPENGEVFTYGDVSVTAMLPHSEEKNNDCAVYRVCYGDVVILYMGDTEANGEELLLIDYPSILKSDILKVGHHGSATSTTQALLRAVTPDYAVISCGIANEYGHPSKTVLDRLGSIGCRISRTDLDGTVVFRTDGETLY